MAEFALLSTCCLPGTLHRCAVLLGPWSRDTHVPCLQWRKLRTEPRGTLPEGGMTGPCPWGAARPPSPPEQDVSLAGRLLLYLHAVCGCFSVTAIPIPPVSSRLGTLARAPRPLGYTLALHSACLSNTPILSSLPPPPSVAPHCPLNKIHPFHGSWALNDLMNFSSTRCLVSSPGSCSGGGLCLEPPPQAVSCSRSRKFSLPPPRPPQGLRSPQPALRSHYLLLVCTTPGHRDPLWPGPCLIH